MNSRPPSVAQIRQSVPPEKSLDAYWCRYILRPISFPVTWVLIRLGLSANQVTYLSVFVVFTATTLMCTGERVLIIVGALLFNVWAILDCTDGNVARVRRENTKYGDFVDALGGYIAFAFVLLAMGITAELSKSNAPDFLHSVDFVLMGALASIFNLTMRLIYQHFRNVSGQRIMREGSLEFAIDSNFGITGLLMPAILIGVLFRHLHWIVLFYLVFYLVAFVTICVRLVIKAERYKKEELSIE